MDIDECLGHNLTGEPRLLRFVVAGTWRGGTNFACNVLRLLGVDCTHETVFTAAMVDMKRAREAEASPAIVNHLAYVTSTLRIPVVQLIRPKALVVASLQKWGGPITEDLPGYWERTHEDISRANPICAIQLEDDDFATVGFLATGHRLGYNWTEEAVRTAVLNADRKRYEDARP